VRNSLAGAGADVDGVETTFLDQFVNGGELADDGVDLDIHTQVPQVLNFGLHHFLRQTELGDTVHQHTARHVERFKHGYLMAELGQIGGTGQAARSGTDHSHFFAGGGGHFLRDNPVGQLPVGAEALDPADAHGLVFFAHCAVLLTLVFLGAYPAADGRQRVLLFQLLNGAGEIPLCSQLDESRNIDFHRAALAARFFLTLDAAVGFGYSDLLRVSKSYLAEVPGPHSRFLGRHFVFLRNNGLFRCFFFSHYFPPPQPQLHLCSAFAVYLSMASCSCGL